MSNLMDKPFFPDLRRARAMALTMRMYQVIRPYIDDEADDRLFIADMMAVLMEAGVEAVTDEMRAEAGLPPRGPSGLTVEELHALERRRIEHLTRPLSTVIERTSAS